MHHGKSNVSISSVRYNHFFSSKSTNKRVLVAQGQASLGLCWLVLSCPYTRLPMEMPDSYLVHYKYFL